LLKQKSNVIYTTIFLKQFVCSNNIALQKNVCINTYFYGNRSLNFGLCIYLYIVYIELTHKDTQKTNIIYRESKNK